MARKLKTYTTSAGFFDLAVAAPSMKAALEAWGSRNNLFHHGFARESDDPQIVAATMARPGVVLRRPVGSDARFSEQSELPKDLATRTATRAAARTPKQAPATRPAQKKPPPTEAAGDRAARKAAHQAAVAFEKEQKRRESERRREEAERKREHERRERAIAAAEAAFEEAESEHRARVAAIEKDRAALERRAEAEDARWRKRKDLLEVDLRKARSTSHLRLV